MNKFELVKEDLKMGSRANARVCTVAAEDRLNSTNKVVTWISGGMCLNGNIK